MPNGSHAFAPVLASFYAGEPEGSLVQLKGDASSRAYFRFRVAVPERVAPKPASLIIMSWPELDAIGGSLDAQARAFIDVRALLSSRGIDVPAIHHVQLDQRLMLLEDLGDETFEARLRRDGPLRWDALYGRAVDTLAELHARCAPPQSLESSIAYRRRLDASLLRWELDHFREWGAEALHGALDTSTRAELDALFDAFTRAIIALPDGFVHRDFQSRNLIWPTPERLVVIDFQDAFIGPEPYDLVALLCDSYVDLGGELQQRMLARYAERRGWAPQQLPALQLGFHLITVQRKLKDAGRFVFIDRVRRNPSFLPFYLGSLRYVDRALTELRERPEAAALRSVLESLLPGFPNCPTPAATSQP